MDTEAALLRAIHERPDDDLAWLALADHLEERGEDERAELLRLTLMLQGRPVGPETAAQEARLQALLASGVKPYVPMRTNSLGMTFALIRPGMFLMGSPENEAERQPEEGPQHEVEITRPFYLGQFPVTQEQYQVVMGNNPSHFSTENTYWFDLQDPVKGRDTRHLPVECVSWEEAVAFCRKLSELPDEERSNRLYRLPTEAEWEYACRAGTSTPFHFGVSLRSTQANFAGNYPYAAAEPGAYIQRTTPVGLYPPNGFGLFDMHGNVWEWCGDWYDEHYYMRSPRQDPPGSHFGWRRIVRGGCWQSGGRDCRAAYRRKLGPGDRCNYYFGFRILLLA